TEDVKQDIQQLLSIDDNNCIVTGFSRDNLSFHLVKGQNKLQYVKQYIDVHRHDAGIIYTATRKQTDTLYNQLADKDVSVYKYHAGLSEAERQAAQQAFIQEDKAIMIATNAFGMG